MVPHLNNVVFSQLANRVGVYEVVRGLFVTKLLLAVLMGLLGPSHTLLLCVFIASNRIFTGDSPHLAHAARGLTTGRAVFAHVPAEGTCKMLNLVVSDLVDEDFIIHQRPEVRLPARLPPPRARRARGAQAVAALVFGTSNLLAKPGQTLAPVLGTLFLRSQLSGEELVAVDAAVPGAAGAGSEQTAAIFSMLVVVPTVCAVLQLVVWTQFRLRGAQLRAIKHAIVVRQRDNSVGNASDEQA